MSQLDILLPFAMPPPELAPDLLRALTLPAFAALLAQSKLRALPTNDEFSRSLPHEAWLYEKFGPQSSLHTLGSPPIAAAALKSAQLEAQAGFWFMLQPVHLHVARDHLVLSDLRQLDLAESDARALFDTVAPYFEEVGKPLSYGDAGTWFVRADDWAGLQTSTPDATCGHNIDIWMPQGAEALQWRKLQNEVQMAWHSHPVNAAREEAGRNPVNSLWLWGGASTDMPVATPQYDALFVNTDWIRAFAQFGSTCGPADSAAAVIAAAPARGLLVLDTLIEPALAGDWAEWIDRLHRYERDWFVPMLDAVRSGTIERLTLILTNSTQASSFSVTRQGLRKFWVKPTLSRLLP
ncbi:MAG: hypothetical protein H7315_12395 [Herminiimonas sp.]|nr:hypothetical protein [Herminiimonas sp.]